MQRSVEFYKVVYDYFPMDESKYSIDQLKSIFVSTILRSLDNSNLLTVVEQGENNSVIIEILEYNDNYLFGIIGKLEDIEGGLLKKLRSKDDLRVIDRETEKPKVYLEYFTYFYLRFNDMKCVVLRNSNAPRFKTHFVNYLKELTNGSNYYGETVGPKDIYIVNVYDDQIDYKINRTRHLTEINMIFEDTSNIGRTLLDLSKSFYISQSDLRKAKISIDLRMSEFSEKTREILKNEALIKSNFKKFEVIGEDYNSNEIQMELVDKLLTKKINIEIDEKYLRSTEDLAKIKEALAGALLL